MSFTQESLDRKVDDIEQRVRQNIETWSGFVDIPTQAYKLARHLWKYDELRNDHLSLDEFKSAMIGLNFVGTQREIIHLFQRYDVNGEGKLPYKEFCNLIFGITPNPKTSAEYRYSMGRFRQEINQHGGVFGVRNLRTVFLRYDTHHDNKLLRDFLVRGLRKEGYVLTDLDAKVVMNCFDKNENGFIEYEEFISGCRGNVKYFRRQLIESVYDKLFAEGPACLEALEANYSGQASFDELMHYWMPNSSSVSKEEFVDFYLDVSAMIFDDDDFQSFLVSSWKVGAPAS